MAGRNGPDHLGIAASFLSLALLLISEITHIGILSTVAYLVLVYAFFRLLSHNVSARRAENERFLQRLGPLGRKLKLQMEKVRSGKNYKFFNCPSCGNTLRVPRGKGSIRITCPKCGERFQGKT